MMQIKFNFNNFVFYGVRLTQLGSVPADTPSSLAAVIGLSNIMTSFRYVPSGPAEVDNDWSGRTQ